MAKTKSTTTRLHRADKKVARKAGRHRATPLVRTLGAVSEVGDQPPLRAIGEAIVLAGLLAGRSRLAGAGARALAAHTVATWVKSAVKANVDRTRPSRWLGGGSYRAKRGHSDDPGLNAFPSGHTAGAVAMAAALGRDYPHLAAPLNSAAAAVAAVQLPRGKHYLSDIVVGALIGGASEWLVSKVFERVSKAVGMTDAEIDQPALVSTAQHATTRADG